jgi:hypothetical protein
VAEQSRARSELTSKETDSLRANLRAKNDELAHLRIRCEAAEATVNEVSSTAASGTERDQMWKDQLIRTVTLAAILLLGVYRLLMPANVGDGMGGGEREPTCA